MLRWRISRITLCSQGRLNTAGANPTGKGHTAARRQAIILPTFAFPGEPLGVVALLTRPRETSVVLAVQTQPRKPTVVGAVVTQPRTPGKDRDGTLGKVVVAVVMQPRQATVEVAVELHPRQTTVVVAVMTAHGKDGDGTLGTHGTAGSHRVGVGEGERCSSSEKFTHGGGGFHELHGHETLPRVALLLPPPHPQKVSSSPALWWPVQ